MQFMTSQELKAKLAEFSKRLDDIKAEIEASQPGPEVAAEPALLGTTELEQLLNTGHLPPDLPPPVPLALEQDPLDLGEPLNQTLGRLASFARLMMALTAKADFVSGAEQYLEYSVNTGRLRSMYEYARDTAAVIVTEIKPEDI